MSAMQTVATPMLELTDVTFGAGGTVLQRNVTFRVERGEIFAILGGSGCGKSTLLRHLIGLETPMVGTISVDGAGAPDLLAGAPRAGVMFQNGALFSSMTVGDNVALPLERWTDLPRDAVAAIVDATLRLVGLDGAASKLPSELSGGMRKRAAFARAMVLGPPLVYLDEPSAGLDPTSAVELDELILTVRRALGLTVVLVSHELESIFKIADRCVWLDRTSQTMIAGEPRALAAAHDHPGVHAFFNRLPRSA